MWELFCKLKAGTNVVKRNSVVANKDSQFPIELPGVDLDILPSAKCGFFYRQNHAAVASHFSDRNDDRKNRRYESGNVNNIDPPFQ